jgi:hypothetical protein
MDDQLRCTGKSKQSGTRCKRSRSPGLDKCALHCGLSREERKRVAEGARAEAAEVLVRFDVPPVSNPFYELKKIAAQQIAYKDKVGEILNRLSVDELRYAGSLRGEQTRAEIGMWQDSTRQCVSVLSVLAKLDVEEHWLAIEDRKIDFMIASLKASLAAAGLTPEATVAVQLDFGRRLRGLGPGQRAEDGKVLAGVVVPPRT